MRMEDGGGRRDESRSEGRKNRRRNEKGERGEKERK